MGQTEPRSKLGSATEALAKVEAATALLEKEARDARLAELREQEARQRARAEDPDGTPKDKARSATSPTATVASWSETATTSCGPSTPKHWDVLYRSMESSLVMA